MKRSFAALMMLLIPALMASCWKTGEDWSLCGADNNFILKFRVQDGSDLTFQNNIHDVDVYLFDADKKFLEHKRVDGSELDSFRGVAFTVTPGIYHVVCWANVADNSRITAMDGDNNFENSYIEIVSTTNGCPIYYAPYKTPEIASGNAGATRAEDYSIYSVEVLPNTETVKELTFAKAHRTVQVYIAGYEYTEHYDGETPVVEYSNTGGKYNFLLHADPTPISLRQPTARGAVKNTDIFSAEFYSALIPLNKDMYVYLHHPASGNIMAAVNIEQYVADNNIADDSLIPIMIVFDMDASVTITMPSWADNSISSGK